MYEVMREKMNRGIHTVPCVYHGPPFMYLACPALIPLPPALLEFWVSGLAALRTGPEV